MGKKKMKEWLPSGKTLRIFRKALTYALFVIAGLMLWVQQSNMGESVFDLRSELEALRLDSKVEKGKFVYDNQVDILKLAVVERHHHTGNVGVGLVEGFGLKNGALAMTIAHDSHNLIIVGSKDSDMQVAAQKIQEIQGGIVLVQNGIITEFLELEVGGIMTAHSEVIVEETLLRMKKKIQKMGLSPNVDDPFISLAFLALPVIPKLKLTDRGLFDVDLFKIVPIEISKKVKV